MDVVHISSNQGSWTQQQVRILCHRAYEALEYLRHPVLGVRLFECTEAVLAITGRSAHDVFGSPDDSKLRSSMTLFEFVSEPESIFVSVLGKYFNGCRDDRTLNLLKQGTS